MFLERPPDAIANFVGEYEASGNAKALTLITQMGASKNLGMPALGKITAS